jgi:hypothetical protein
MTATKPGRNVGATIGVGDASGVGEPFGTIDGGAEPRIRKTGPVLAFVAGVGVGIGGGVTGLPVGMGVA